MKEITDYRERWYCVRSAAGYECRAAELLSRVAPTFRASAGDIEAFCPMVRKLMHVAGHRREVSGALFPGYFFSRFRLDCGARFVGSRPGVIGLVRLGDEPTPVPDDVIEELKSTDFIEAAEEALLSQRFVPGQRLVIHEGPFAGMEAEYVASLNDGQRAVLLIEYLSRQVRLTAETATLESAA